MLDLSMLLVLEECSTALTLVNQQCHHRVQKPLGRVPFYVHPKAPQGLEASAPLTTPCCICLCFSMGISKTLLQGEVLKAFSSSTSQSGQPGSAAGSDSTAKGLRQTMTCCCTCQNQLLEDDLANV